MRAHNFFSSHLLALLIDICVQEVARILEDQIRSQQEQMDSTLREVDEKYTEKEKAINEKLDTVNKKLTSALAEITVKDNLVKQHIKVAEEAVVGKIGFLSFSNKISNTSIVVHCSAC